MSVIKLSRFDKNHERTIGLFCYDETCIHSLEDKERGLTSGIPVEAIKLVKIKGATAIPTGRYEVQISYSNRFKKLLPILLNVPGFEGIRIHSGNTHHDTEGCILIGNKKDADTVFESRIAMEAFMNWLEAELDKGKVFIEVS
jgi:heme-degrading monooxygenase HmoA